MVNKIAYLFPGQGSQFVGMGKLAFDRSTKAQYLFEKADRLLGFSLSKYMFEGPEEKLKETEITQPALFLASAAALELLKEKSIKAHAVAGHSLGEYSALYAAGVLGFDDTLRLVRARGMAMAEEGVLTPGAMAAILGLPYERVKTLCDSIPADLGPCVPANYNAETQIVISGTKEAVAEGMALAGAAGALKTIPLNVSGAFHSPLMKNAALKMQVLIEAAPFTVADTPVVTNVDARPTTTPDDFKRKLVQQIDHGVMWHSTLTFLLENGTDTFIEVGAGKVLGTMVRKLDRKKLVFSTDDFGALDAFISAVNTPTAI